MLKNILFTCLMSFFLISEIASEENDLYGIPDYFPLSLESVDTFEGDQHRDFKGDFIAVLNDGSRWKIHPQDSSKFGKWNMGDPLHIACRTSYYYFKREHKAEIVNLANNETVRAMIVQYPTHPLFIAYIEDHESGIPLKMYTKGDQILRTKYTTRNNKYLHLSDGTIWEINTYYSNYARLYPGKFVYVSFNKDKNGFCYFLISDSEREANFTKIAKARIVKENFEEYEKE